MASSPTAAEVLLSVSVSAPAGGRRTANVTAAVPHAPATYSSSFAMEVPDGPEFAVRVLADRTLAEIFLGGGRGFGRAGIYRALAALFHQHGLAATMRKALAHLAGFDRALQAQRFTASSACFAVFACFCVAHRFLTSVHSVCTSGVVPI